jgi:hypothetical protein
MPPAGFEPVIPASDRPHTLALHRSATEIGFWKPDGAALKLVAVPTTLTRFDPEL